MVLRFVQLGNSLPVSYPIDPSATFESGMIAQLNVSGNQIVCGISDGSAPLGGRRRPRAGPPRPPRARARRG